MPVYIPDTYEGRAYGEYVIYDFHYTYTQEDIDAGLSHTDCMMRDFEEFFKTVIRDSFNVEHRHQWKAVGGVERAE